MDEETFNRENNGQRRWLPADLWPPGSLGWKALEVAKHADDQPPPSDEDILYSLIMSGHDPCLITLLARPSGGTITGSVTAHWALRPPWNLNGPCWSF